MGLFSKNNYSNNYRKTGLETNCSNYGWYTCAHCGKKFRANKVDIDHIKPKSKGGSNNPKNLQVLCQHCNRSKGNKTDKTKQDLKTRKKTYAEYKSSIYFKGKTQQVMNDIRKELSANTTNELRFILKSCDNSKDEIDRELKKLVLKEARKRGMNV